LIMRFLTSALIAAAASASFSEPVNLGEIAALAGVKPSDSIVELRHKFLNYLTTYASGYVAAHPEATPSEYPYFNFIPMHRASITPDSSAVTWSGKCFSENSAVIETLADGTQQITITTSGSASSEGCSDTYWLMTVTGIEHVTIDRVGTTTLSWNVPSDVSNAELWDLKNKGVRVMEFLTDKSTTVANLLETVLMFIPEFTKQVDPLSAARNVDFMAKYPQVVMEKRDPLSSLPPPESMVHSGDFFGIIRLDGLDPMLAWAMGSTTGHTTVAQWIDGELYICESTVTDSYWPTNGIQKTPYRIWLKQAEEAGYNVVHVPLNQKTRLKYNETASTQFFLNNEGFDYGYITMLWGWLDTLVDNYPCVPSDYSSVCLTWDLVEPLFAVIDREIPQISDLMWNPAWNKRIGTDGLGTAEIYEAANSKGIDSIAIPTIVEQDDWTYATTRYGEPAEGKAMVCCVFVCNMWKAAGVFGDMELNCAEMTNWDDYVLDIFEDSYKQILGRYTLNLNNYHSKHPYPHMAETCASLAPDYEKSEYC